MKSPTVLMDLIQEGTRQIKEAEESPTPTDFSLTNRKQLLELGKERLEAELDAWQRGIPIGVTGSFGRLLRSMGFLHSALTNTLCEDPSAETYGKYKARIQAMGLPEKCCEKTILEITMTDLGEVPTPTIILSTGHGCDVDHKLGAQSIARWLNVPVYYIDVGIDDDMDSDDKVALANINYVADQLGELIEWAERKVPGVKYDEARLMELQEVDARAHKYGREIYELVQHVPCPITPADGLALADIVISPSRYPNMEKVVEWHRIARDEIGERVASGRGPYPEERLRLLWAGQGHAFRAIDPLRSLLKRGVAMPMAVHGGTFHRYHGRWGSDEVSEFGSKLSPLQKEAAPSLHGLWGGRGKRWADRVIQAARSTGTHGVIHFNLIGCTPQSSMGAVVADRADKELGIPTLNFEGRLMEPFISQERFDAMLSVFIDKCFDRAGRPRQ